MWEAIRELDRVLRGEATGLAAIREHSIEVHARRLLVVLVVLAGVYGFFAGWYGALQHNYMQLIASTVKLPLLFLLTVMVTFPSLYVFNALVGSRLTIVSLIKLLVASLAVTIAVMTSFSTIVAFFSVTTDSYSFMVLLNVACCTVGGILGLAFLLRTLQRLSSEAYVARPAALATDVAAPDAVDEDPEEAVGRLADAAVEVQDARLREPSPLDPMEGQVFGPQVKTVFRCWIIVFALVGAQMAWVLRPFIGNPDQPFEWFRARQSNFFIAVWGHLVDLVR